MKILFYDCFSGISGDMNLGALLDLGVDKEYFLKQLSLLGLEREYTIAIRTEQRKGITGTRVDISLRKDQSHINKVDNREEPIYSELKESSCLTNWCDLDKEDYQKLTNIAHENTKINMHKDMHESMHKNVHENRHKYIDENKHNNIQEKQNNKVNKDNKEIHGSDHHTKSSHGRNLKDIARVIAESTLVESIKCRSMYIFENLAEAEAKIHGITKDEVHFHEVGGTDAIIDIVGAAICLEYLQVDTIYSSKVELGGGFVRCEHGLLPVPAPAVSELLKGIPVKTGRVEFETTTPTGAAILSSVVDKFCEKMDFSIKRIGYGIGKRDIEIPNVLRVYLGEIPEFSSNVKIVSGKATSGNIKDKGKEDGDLCWEKELQWMLETNIDDMNPEMFQYVEEKLYAEGALDVYKTPIIMKKGRPAVKLSVLAPKIKLQELKAVIFLETTAIGLRSYEVEKTMLTREFKQIETQYGPIKVKFAYLEGEFLKYKPEYEDCKKLAYEKEIPIREIYKEIENCMFMLSEVHTKPKP